MNKHPGYIWLTVFSLISQCLIAAPIAFNVSYTDGPAEGFNDPTLGPARRTAFEYAANLWSNFLARSYPGETITISARFDPLGGSATAATLASAGPVNVFALGTVSSPTGYLWFNAANANHVATFDIVPTAAEIIATANSDVDNSTVLGTTDFYYGLDGNNGSDVDFVTVILHEIAHGLGFTSLINSTTGGYENLSGTIPPSPSLYDYFLGRDNGDSTFTQLLGMDDATRLNAITSDTLFWLGSRAANRNAGDWVKLYAPDPFKSGSSITHIDEVTYPDALMSPVYSGVLHAPDTLTLGMLEDMLWTIPEPNTALLLLLAFSFLNLSRPVSVRFSGSRNRCRD